MARRPSSSPRKKSSSRPEREVSSQESLPEPPASSPRSRRLAWLGFALVLLAAMAWPLSHAYLIDQVTTRLCGQMDETIAPEKRMPVFLSEIAFDGYVWNRHAEVLGQDGSWRVRQTDLDNAPHGREVHWNSAFAWYLRGLGEIYRSVTGEPLRHSIFRMSIWANPILLALAILVFSTLSARRFGPLCGAVLALGMVAVPTFYEGFMPAYPDHHGLIAFALLGLLFGLAWAGGGWVQPEDGRDFAPPRNLRQARQGMIFSALCGAAGLWFSALSTALVLGTIGAAALLMALLSRSPRRVVSFHPGLWKTWAIYGAAASLALYLLEYFPFDLGWRLEVNHPLYALAWLGGGWLIALFAGWWINGRSSTPFPWKKFILPVLVCLPLPALIIFGGTEVYLPKDPFMGRLWKNIAELLPLLTRIQHGGLTWQIAFGWFPLLLLAALGLQFSTRVGSGTKSTLQLMAFPILLITALQFYQVRWGMLAGPLYLGLAALVLPQFWQLVPHRSLPRLAAAALLAAFAFVFIQPSFANSFQLPWSQYKAAPGQIPLTAGQALALLHRQMALVIAEDAGDEPVVLLSSPNSSCLLSTLGGFRTVGTLYWENVEGLKAAATALNAQNDAEALALLKEHGITHISFLTWENFIDPFFRILHPTPVAGRSYGNSFGKRALFDRVIPSWSRPLIFPPNSITQGLNQQVLLLRVAPEQDLPTAQFHLARFAAQVENNPAAARQLLQQILQNNPDHPTAQPAAEALKTLP